MSGAEVLLIVLLGGGLPAFGVWAAWPPAPRNRYTWRGMARNILREDWK